MHSAEMLAGRLLAPRETAQGRCLGKAGSERRLCSSPGHAAGRCQSGDAPGTVTVRKGQKEREKGLERSRAP